MKKGALLIWAFLRAQFIQLHGTWRTENHAGSVFATKDFHYKGENYSLRVVYTSDIKSVATMVHKTGDFMDIAGRVNVLVDVIDGDLRSVQHDAELCAKLHLTGFFNY